MTQPQVIQVSRDDNGIVYTGDTLAPQGEPTSAPKPIKVRSKRAAEKLGWRVWGKPEHLREVPGTNYLEKMPGEYGAECTCSFRGDMVRAHRLYAPTLESLLEQIQSFEERNQ